MGFFPPPKRSEKAKARVVAKEREKDDTREGRPLVPQMRRIDYIFSNNVETQQVMCHFCQEYDVEGTHECQSCFKWLIAWSDGRIATEVCRMEIVAKKTNKVFALDKIDFEKQPRSQRVSDRTRADQRRAGRSNFGNLKDAAQKHAGRYGKMGFAYIQDRMEKGPYYLFNSTTARLWPTVACFWKISRSAFPLIWGV